MTYAQTVKRPWGGYSILKKESKYWIKLLSFAKGARFSLQRHLERSEIWVVLSGTIQVTVGADHHTLGPGKMLIVRKKMKHQIKGVTRATVLEVAFGNPKEHDIIRYQDNYGRV